MFNDKNLKRQFLRMVLTSMVIMMAITGSCTYYVSHTINKAGGVKQIMIDAGKGIKDIKNEVNEHEPE